MACDRTYILKEVLRHDGVILNLANETRALERGRPRFSASEGGGTRIITYPSRHAFEAAAIQACLLYTSDAADE